ncbi:hypothetical protein JCM8097_005786 [Rhodosporidiobolus ruineniae]
MARTRIHETAGDGVLAPQPPLHSSAEYSQDNSALSSPDLDDHKLDSSKSDTASLYDVTAYPPLAAADDVAPSPGRALLEFLHLRKRSKVYDLDAIATKESVFDGPLGAHYVPGDEYENKAAFDPSFRWTYREERAVTRKIDWRLLSWILLMFLALDIDRGNLGNATADNLLTDLGLSQSDYNLGNTLSKLGFLLAELPSQMFGKKVGVDIWLPTQMVIFSILALAQFAMRGRTSFLALRFIIAFFQGGFIPDVILYLTYYYDKHALPIRLAFFYTINYIANLITAFLAVGLLKMRGVGGYAGWRWMFLIEGLFTLVVGIASYFMLPPGPSQTKAKWRPNGLFTDREVKIIVNRVLRDDPQKSSMHNREALTFKLLWKSLCDYDLWPLYAVGIIYGVSATPISNYFQLSMYATHHPLSSDFTNQNVLPSAGDSSSFLDRQRQPPQHPQHLRLTLHPHALTILSEVFDSRTWLASLQNWWMLIFYIPLVTLPDPVKPWTWFAIATLLLGFPYVHVIHVGWVSRNAGSVRTRTVASSLYNMSVQLSAIIGSNLYQASEAPRYKRANKVILGITAFNLVVLYPSVWFYYRWRNGQKEKTWGKMSTEERAQYLATTTDEGAKRLDFRFAY